MDTALTPSRQANWLGITLWLLAFVSPSACFLILLLANDLQISGVPTALAWSMIFLSPLIALLICEIIVWFRSRSASHRLTWMAFTLLAMIFQCGVILLILRVFIVTRIGFAR